MSLAVSAIKALIADNKSPLSQSDRDKWLAVTSDNLKMCFQAKYSQGQLTHEGDLGALTIKQLLQEMENEALDQLAYVRELKRRINV